MIFEVVRRAFDGVIFEVLHRATYLGSSVRGSTYVRTFIASAFIDFRAMG